MVRKSEDGCELIWQYWFQCVRVRSRVCDAGRPFFSSLTFFTFNSLSPPLLFALPCLIIFFHVSWIYTCRFPDALYHIHAPRSATFPHVPS